MPRYPRLTTATEGLSDRVFSELHAKALARGQQFVPLHVGDTYLEPLDVARAEAQLSASVPRLHNYAPVQGEPALLEAIVDKVERRAGVRLDRECVQVMAGATAGLSVVSSVLLEPGDEVILPAPFWPLIRGIIRARGARAVEVPCFDRLADPGFDVEAALQRALSERTAAIYLNSPNNPTGSVLPDDVVAAIASFARRHDLWVICDEVYEDLWFGSEAPPPVWAHPALAERAVVTHSVSKAYGLAGARVGYTHGPPALMERIRGAQTFFTYCAPRPMQRGAARALAEGDEWLAQARRRYEQAARLAAEQLSLPMPAGGTFLFFDASPWLAGEPDVMPLLERCLDAGVMLTPGASSGSAYGSWVRLCFTAVPPPELRQALEQLARLLHEQPR